MTNGWIGVDFDGTLATDPGCQPIIPMVERVKQWLKEGRYVRIVTARVCQLQSAFEIRKQREFVQCWCEHIIGHKLPVTNEKDYEMQELWDDRAVQVIRNTGERVGNIIR